ncbi:cobalt transporter CbiM [Alisedimentitalea sp. MJ-SS2]|uniref:cobalt transporter CbiM n=1 Tax=Aliisedimentitalea sp. MJ-SS2 TaxID=3049795 RepID=UPI002909A1F6|nr:cobalt transporter CbiM [Alisedimentitalea sp. MJ-SS2]MDU8927543.1 cobalt transporter CbiM [Alisedimentitalea sp. MJ-SS2]
MHIVDGALANPVVIGGAALAVGGIAMGLRKLDLEKIPAAGVLSASFFVASLIHVPIGPSSVHLILGGLAGLVLGWAAFPALFVGLLLQAVFFGFGGLSVLGVNTVIIAGPAVAVHYLCTPFIRRGDARLAWIWGAIGGGVALAMTGAMVALALALSGQAFFLAAKLVILAHVPVMAVEAVLTGAAVYLMRQVKPELFLAWGEAQA